MASGVLSPMVFDPDAAAEAIAAPVLYARSVLARYPFAEAELAGWHARLGQLHARLEREPFRVALVGEFSSGKSTLINALLGAAALPVAATPSTRLCYTLCFGERFDVEVTLRGQRPLTYAADRDALLRHLHALDADIDPAAIGLEGTIAALTTRETIASQVETCTIRCPAPLLRRGLILVDTPGLHDSGAHGGDVSALLAETRRSVDEADAVLVLIPALVQVSMTLAGFLRDTVRHKPRRLFLITKADHLEDAEDVRRVVESTRAKLEAQELERPAIMVVAAQQALVRQPEMLGPAQSVASEQEWAQAFVESQAALAQWVRAGQLMDVAEGVMAALEELPAAVRRVAERQAHEHRAREATIHTAIIEDLPAFCTQEYAHAHRTADGQVQQARRDIAAYLPKAQQQTQAALWQEIARARSRRMLKQALRTQVAPLLWQHTALLGAECQRTLSAFYAAEDAAGQASRNRFVAAFERLHQAAQREPRAGIPRDQPVGLAQPDLTRYPTTGVQQAAARVHDAALAGFGAWGAVLRMARPAAAGEPGGSAVAGLLRAVGARFRSLEWRKRRVWESLTPSLARYAAAQQAWATALPEAFYHQWRRELDACIHGLATRYYDFTSEIRQAQAESARCIAETEHQARQDSAACVEHLNRLRDQRRDLDAFITSPTLSLSAPRV